MSIPRYNAIDYSKLIGNEPCQDFQTKNVYQPEGNPPFLNLPLELLLRIVQLAASHPSPTKSAIRLVEIGRVCVLTHLLTDNTQLPTPEASFHSVINNENKLDDAVYMYSSKFDSPPALIAGRREGYIVHQRHISCLLATRQEARDAIVRYEEEYKKAPFLPPTPAFHDDPLKRLIRYASDGYSYPIRLLLLDEEQNNKDALKVFYVIFKKTVAQFSNEKAKFIAQASVCALYNEPLFQQSFERKLLNDKLNEFTTIPIEDLTIPHFPCAVRSIESTLTKSYSEIEFQLRKEIQKVHGLRLIKLSEEYKNGQYIQKVKNELSAIYTHKINAMKNEIDRLCGPNNFDGEINRAYTSMLQAKEELKKTKLNYLDVLKIAQNSIESSEDDDVSNFIGKVSSSTEPYVKALEKYRECSAQHQDLTHQLSELAVWENNIITGGKKVELEAKLSDSNLLTLEAEAKCERLANFYHQLSREITEENKEQLSQDLDDFIRGGKEVMEFYSNLDPRLGQIIQVLSSTINSTQNNQLCIVQ